MKKTGKRILIGFSVIIGIVIVLFLAYFITAQSAVKKMTPVETGKITEDVYAIKDSFVNMYLIRTDSGFIAVDAGNKSEVVSKELSKSEIDPLKVSAVLLTHSDADHVAAIPLFPNASVYMSKLEEQMINGKTPRFLLFGNTLECDRIKLLNDDQMLIISGCPVRCISTPGHTPGSMSYLVNGKFLFTGDCLRLKKGKVTEFIHFINMDTRTERISIDKLSRLRDIGYLFTAHYGMTDRVVTAFEAWEKN